MSGTWRGGAIWIACPAYSAVNQGHCHPKILQALIDQASRLTLTSRAFRNDQLALFYQEICALTGVAQSAADEFRRRSGGNRAEAGAQMGTGQGRGRRTRPRSSSAPTISMAAPSPLWAFPPIRSSREGSGPFTAGFRTIPFGDAAALEAAIGPNSVAFLVEPIQGEAGVIVPPPGYLKKARALCTQHNVLFILDEIQTGLGRTGKLLAEEHEGVEADLTLLGKALSGGFYPVSAVLSNNEVMSVLHPGEHGSTFGGNPLACAVARTALRVLVEEGMIENAARVGARLKAALQDIRSNQIKEVRGHGLLIGGRAGARSGRRAGGLRATDDARASLAKETHDHTIRMSPPLILTDEQADWIAGQFRDVLI